MTRGMQTVEAFAGIGGLSRKCAVLLLMVAMVGCNRSGLDLAPVEGVVTFNGAPVENAGVLFMPAAGPFAMGTTDADGKFTLVTANHAGALVGEHRVAISKTETLSKQYPGERYPRYSTKTFIPERYSTPSTSDLTATVTNDGDENNFKFELTGKISGS
jgi:hypothetical protein